MFPSFNNIPDIFAGVAVGLLGVAFGLLQYYKNWKTTGGEVVLISQLQTEVTRYIKQNETLFSELLKLQDQVRAMNTQLTRISVENDALREQLKIVRQTCQNNCAGGRHEYSN